MLIIKSVAKIYKPSATYLRTLLIFEEELIFDVAAAIEPGVEFAFVMAIG